MRLPLALSLLAILACHAGAAEAQVATPFEVRKEAQELLDDLAKRTPGSEDAALLERVQQLMARHGAKLVDDPSAKSTALPLSEILIARLKQLGLAERFVELYGPLAERRLGGRNAPDADLVTLARSYPTTPAARTAWSILADRAWDRGRLAAFMQCATLSGSADATGAAAGTRSQRLAAARQLLITPPLAPPSTLDGIDEMWRQPLDLRSAPSKANARQIRLEAQRGPSARIALSPPLGDLLCGSDGRRAFVVDHLVGRVEGPLVPVGNTPLLRRQCVPAVLRDGFAVCGVQDQRLSVVALARDGTVRWRTGSPSLGNNPLISAPVAIDQVVAVALVVADDEAADVRVQGYRQDTGELAWDVLVARLAGHRSWMFAGDQAYALIPAVCVQGDHLLVLSNSGIIARLSPDGDLQRVWTYRSPGGEVEDNLGNQGAGRMGALVSDGRLAVATPADLQGQTLILDGDAAPEAYRGDGAGGEVLAVSQGRAFLAGARLVGVDLAQRKAVWDQPAPGVAARGAGADLQAVIGLNSLIVAGRDGIAAYDPASGDLKAKRGLERPVGLSVGEQTIVVAADNEGAAYCAAYGGATSVVERLTAAAKADPTDIRSVVALAAMAAARDQTEQALSWYDEAFRRGAGVEYATKAAKLLRTRLDLATPQTWEPLLARFAALTARDPSLAGEGTYWQARWAEARGDRAAAQRGYTEVRERSTHSAQISLRDDLTEHLGLLATCGLRRLDATLPLPWDRQPAVAAVPLKQPWKVTARRGRSLVIGGSTVVGYADGVLTANQLGNGAEVWWRRPQRPLLGVRSRPEQVPDGVAIDIMPGTSAAAAGLLPEDVLQRFNGQEMRSFTADLVPAVLALTVRAPFTAQVRRGAETVTINGTLGGEMVEPVTANERTVLVWPTMIGPGVPAVAAAAPGTRPEGLWVAVHDLATGAELWRHAVPPATQDELPARPLLTPDDLVVLADGGDLVALPAHPPAGTKDLQPVWRLTGQSDLLRNAKVIGRNLLWLAEQGRDESLLVEAATGRPWARLPIEATQEPVLLGADLYARTEDGTLTAWDLGLGRKRWTIPNIARLAAASGDTLWVVNVTGQLIAIDRFAGTVRRLYGEWLGVIDSRVSGERLFLHATPTATTHALACISLTGGAVLWQQNLPGDLAAMEPLADGVGCLLAGSKIEGQTVQPPVALAFSALGDLLHLAALTDDVASAQVRFLAGGLLIAEASGLRADPAAIPATPPAVPAGTPGNPDQLAWQQAGSARYALALRPDQTCEAWVDVAGDEVLVRLGQLGHVIDLEGQTVRLPAEAAGAPTVPAQVSAERMPGAATGGQRWKIVFAPVLGWKAGIPLQVRVDAGNASDCPPTPWWLRTCWRTVVPPGTAPGTVPPKRDGK